jgi:hypothetical protein
MMSEEKRTGDSERGRCIGTGMVIGMLIFAPAGFVLWIATGSPGLIGVGPAVGLAIGLAIGEGLYQRSQQKDADER